VAAWGRFTAHPQALSFRRLAPPSAAPQAAVHAFSPSCMMGFFASKKWQKATESIPCNFHQFSE
jgi:hypothetical protein